jgi:hypothetical protein
MGSYILAPYTRAQYLALPRKKKKKVLTDLRHLREREEENRKRMGAANTAGAHWDEVRRWEDSVKRGGTVSVAYDRSTDKHLTLDQMIELARREMQERDGEGGNDE